MADSPARMAAEVEFPMRIDDRTPTERTDVAQPAEESIREARTMLLGQLVPPVAHELNNAFSTILGLAQLLHIQCGASDGLKQSLDMMLRSAEAGADLLRRLVSVANGAAGQLVPVNPPELLSYVKPLMDKVVKGRANVHMEVSVGLPVVVTDRRDVEMLLLSAAVVVARHGASDGKLRVIARRIEPTMERGDEADVEVRLSWLVPDSGLAATLACVNRALAGLRLLRPVVIAPEEGRPLVLMARLSQ